MLKEKNSNIKIRINIDNAPIFGPGKVQLLESIDIEGSISAAARTIGMSYRRAWILVEAINKYSKKKVVETHPGGKGGGGAIITKSGKDIIKLYRHMEVKASNSINKEKVLFEKYFNK